MKSPAIILIRPQIGENIGAAARVMLNFGMRDLRIVAPRDGWPNEKALDMAVGAAGLVEKAKIYNSLEDAVSDIRFLLAATARKRDMEKPVISSKQAGFLLREKLFKCGIIFGPERTGLSNDDMIMADNIVTIPVNVNYTSMNLAQSIAILCYEWFSCDASATKTKKEKPAPKKDMSALFKHLEQELDKSAFFRVPEKRRKTWENIRTTFQRTNMTAQEVRTLRGVIRSLTQKKSVK